MPSPVLFSLAGLLFAAIAEASFDGNINYLSPSTRHPVLGIDVGQVERRSWKRGSVALEPSELSFTHGVASGDPWPWSVILWTRIAPSNESDASDITVTGAAPLYSHETSRFIDASPNPICVEWSVFTGNGTHGSDSLVASGEALTSSDIDYTVEARGLEPLTQYSYQFNVCGSDKKSPLGRTKTAPRPDDDVSEMSFAVFSCSNFPVGYFNAYGNTARKDQHDFVIHLGDYIYDSTTTALATAKQYRTDPDLQLLSKNYAWIPTWDDHEFSDNGYRDGFSGLNNTEDSFLRAGAKVTVDTRKVNAVRAYFEWMPIRQADLDDGLRVWRSFQMGKLLDIIMLDTRNYDRSITTLGWNDNYIDLIRDDPSRTLMGSRQESWFYDSLKRSQDRGARWRIVGNQIVFSRILDNDQGAMSGDDWNGYMANRNRTLQHIYDNEIGNNIFLAGDSHQNWVSDLVWLGTKEYDKETGSGAVGVEFAGTAGTYGPGRADRACCGRQCTGLHQAQRRDAMARGLLSRLLYPRRAAGQGEGSVLW
ncbi:Alkaline phosphatase D-related protein [Ophiocordyceps sinensis CO18]|uniref:Alkaline phosphatase D-related protein n=1 Tax=Ophiocordyceps sinensis (strain Co18 / CGMCC 3.14243) TaxID=911162 RepID=T5A570_OPHSC|nr:Alkaline phosphatase D-related protein [Ophiocordyceps sinensis CO18]